MILVSAPLALHQQYCGSYLLVLLGCLLSAVRYDACTDEQQLIDLKRLQIGFNALRNYETAVR
jgi:hypothetical protein